MKNNKILGTIVVFSIIFVCGIILVLNSLSLGNFYAREYYNGGGGWSLSLEKANMKSIPFMIVGTLLAFLSGFGVVLLTVKKIFDARN